MCRPRWIAIRTLGPVALAFSLAGWMGAQDSGDPLRDGFLNPPDSAKPRVWWHWMNGNITKEGIKLDLEWMKRVGIGGFQNFDAAFGAGSGNGALDSGSTLAGSSKPFATRSATVALPMALASSITTCSGGGSTIMFDHCTEASTRR